jgi:hypothetical protein
VAAQPTGAAVHNLTWTPDWPIQRWCGWTDDAAVGQWSIIGHLVGALAGVLAFLAVVAGELGYLDSSLHLRKTLEAEWRARQRAREQAAR